MIRLFNKLQDILDALPYVLWISSPRWHCCRKLMHQIAPGELRSSERLGQDAQDWCISEMDSEAQGSLVFKARQQAHSTAMSLGATQKTGEKTSKMLYQLTKTA